MNKKQYLQTTWILFKKELAGYFNSPIAYIFIAVFLVVGNWMFFNPFFLVGETSMRAYFELLPWIFLFLAPAVTMRLWSEEKKSGTVELLLTLPIKDSQAVLAKFFSALTFLSLALLLSLSLPLSLARLGNLDWGPVIGGYVGGIFLAGAYLSLGLFISALTKNQIIAFISALVACFIAFMIGADFFLINIPQALRPIFGFLGLGNHFFNIARGVIDSKDVIYYLSFTFFFLWLNTQIIKRRVWK